jgi:hypothetical protein
MASFGASPCATTILSGIQSATKEKSTQTAGKGREGKEPVSLSFNATSFSTPSIINKEIAR